MSYLQFGGFGLDSDMTWELFRISNKLFPIPAARKLITILSNTYTFLPLCHAALEEEFHVRVFGKPEEFQPAFETVNKSPILLGLLQHFDEFDAKTGKFPGFKRENREISGIWTRKLSDLTRIESFLLNLDRFLPPQLDSSLDSKNEPYVGVCASKFSDLLICEKVQNSAN